MASSGGYIKVDGLKPLQAKIRKSTDRDLPKRLGQANKQIGQLVIDKLRPRPQPDAVGQGAGASVRASASKRDVLLRVGGAHRRDHSPQMQWGKRPARTPGRRAPKRPYIRGTVDDHRTEIYNAWLKAISDAMDPAFHKTEP